MTDTVDVLLGVADKLGVGDGLEVRAWLAVCDWEGVTVPLGVKACVCVWLAVCVTDEVDVPEAVAVSVALWLCDRLPDEVGVAVWLAVMVWLVDMVWEEDIVWVADMDWVTDKVCEGVAVAVALCVSVALCVCVGVADCDALCVWLHVMNGAATHGPGSRGPAELNVTPVAVTVTPLPLESTKGIAPFAAFRSSVVPATGGSVCEGVVNAAAEATTRKFEMEPFRTLNVVSPPREQGLAADAEKLEPAAIAAEATWAPLTSQTTLVFERTSAMCCHAPHTAVYVETTFPVESTSLDAPTWVSSIESSDVQQTPMEKGRASDAGQQEGAYAHSCYRCYVLYERTHTRPGLH